MAKAAIAPRSANGGLVKSADRVMAVLDLVAERGALPFSEISAALALPKSSAYSLLRTMEARGYLSIDDERHYRLGSRIWELAQAFHEVDDLRTLMKPLMDEVVERTGETVQRPHPRRGRGGLSRAVGVAAPDEADLARRRPPARLHERDRQSAARLARSLRRRPGGGWTAPSSTSSPTTRSSRSRHSSPSSSAPASAATRSTTRSSRSACAASPCRSATSTTR